MAESITLIVGLGNPGREYVTTRHNAGANFAAAVAERIGADFRSARKFHAQLAETRLAGQRLWLMIPDTYMNCSGDAVAAFARFHKIPFAQILVVHDELDLPPGTVRVKRGGGAGGHNGLTDVIAKLGSRDFNRLRIGIGHPGTSRQVTGYVLRSAPQDEQALIDAAIDDACDQLESIVAGDFEKAMNALHARRH